MLRDQDRHDEAGAAIRQALDLAERAGTPRLGVICTTAAAHYFEAGQWDDALAVLETAAGLRASDYIPVFLHGQVALIAGHRDDQAMAEEHLAAVRDQPLDSAQHRAAAYCLLQARAQAAERAGRPEKAATVLAQCLQPEFAEDMTDRYLLLPRLTRVALAVGDAVTAAAAAQAAADEAERGPMAARSAAADHCRGLVNGDPVPVLDAAAYYQLTGRPLARAQALEDAAVLLAGRGDLPAGRRAFSDAARLYADLGAAWDSGRGRPRGGTRLPPPRPRSPAWSPSAGPTQTSPPSCSCPATPCKPTSRTSCPSSAPTPALRSSASPSSMLEGLAACRPSADSSQP
jgi:hypothetical protein